MFRRIALLSSVGILAAPAARGGVTATFQVKEGTRTLALEGNKARVEDPEEITIFDGDARRVLTLNRAEKTYTEMTPATMRAQTARMKAEWEETKGRLTPEQSAQIEAMSRSWKGGPSGPAKPTLVSTGKKDKVAGYTCEVHRYLVDGRPTEELCLIPWGAGALTRADVAPFVKMTEMFTAALEDLRPGAGEAMKASKADLASMPGFLARSYELGPDGKRVETETLTKIARGSVPATAFAIPAGYTRAEEVPPRASRQRREEQADDDEPEEPRR